MPITDNVFVAVSDGDECFVCERLIERGRIVIGVSFNISILITTTTVKKVMHRTCAEQLQAVLGLRISEIYNRERR